jgi:NAD(P)-dependent dehydrogenase (short-subunit alcohol dehydrogenase family)
MGAERQTVRLAQEQGLSAPLVVLTGGSSGLGAAMAEQLAGSGHRVLSLARRRSDALPEAVQQWEADLSDPVPVTERLRTWLAGQSPAEVASATLISNAGTNTAPGPLSHADPAELSRALRVDLEAAVLLTSTFLASTRSWPVPRKVLLISSGVGRRPLAGSATYGAAKAGLDQLARAVALEEAAEMSGARIVSLAPGRFETRMMALMRDADPELFPNREEFVKLKEEGELDTPEEAAAKVLAYLARPDFGDEPVADVRKG